MADAAPPRPSSPWFFTCWTLVGSAALLSSLRVSNSFLGWWVSLVIFHRNGRGFGPERNLHLWSSLPLALGVIGLGSLAIPNRKAKGAVLTLAAGAALLAAYVDIVASKEYLYTLRTWIGLMAGAAMIAAGNHVMKRVPGRKLPAIVAALGGVRVIASCLLPNQDYRDRSVVYEIGGAGHLREDEVAALFAVILLIYALFGILLPFVRSILSARNTAVSILGYLMLFLFPLAIHYEWMQLSGGRAESANADHAAFMLKFWLLGTGYTLLLGVGAATWMEGFLLERTPRQSST